MHNEKLYTLIKSPIVTEKSARIGESLKQIVSRSILILIKER